MKSAVAVMTMEMVTVAMGFLSIVAMFATVLTTPNLTSMSPMHTSIGWFIAAMATVIIGGLLVYTVDHLAFAAQPTIKRIISWVTMVGVLACFGISVALKVKAVLIVATALLGVSLLYQVVRAIDSGVRSASRLWKKTQNEMAGRAACRCDWQ